MPIFVLSEDLVFPPAHLATPEGLLAMGGDLEPDRILLAYKNGIFPWYSQGEPILWWSPNPRMILLPDSFNSTKSLNKKITPPTKPATLPSATNKINWRVSFVICYIKK